jgi:hypothetical protein
VEEDESGYGKVCGIVWGYASELKLSINVQLES